MSRNTEQKDHQMTILRLKILSKMIFLNDFNVFVRDNPNFDIFSEDTSMWNGHTKKRLIKSHGFFYTSNALTTRAWESVDRHEIKEMHGKSKFYWYK